MSGTKMHRRDFLRISALAAVGAMAVACAKTTEPTTAPEATKAGATEAPATKAPEPTAAPAAAKEAPMWVAKVESGDLPALDDRLPSDAMVVTPADQIGTYGGTWHTSLLGRADSPWISRTHAYQPLLRWSEDLTEPIANVASGWEVTDAGKEFVFTLRKGCKWSDGEPLTADDFVFWWEEEQMNTDVNALPTSWMRPGGGEAGSITKVDDTTVSFKFPVPNGLFIAQMASNQPFVPAHYAENFHINYNKDAVEKATAEGQFQDWVAYYQARMDHRDNVERPVQYAWAVRAELGEGVQYEVERNAYFWKVDPEGNQLPYIDDIVYPIVESVDVAVMKALNGEIDMQDRHIATPANKSVFVDNMEKGGYGFFQVETAWESPCIISVNLAHPDLAKRELYLQTDFRIALSYALNRQEIIDTIYVGDGEPCNVAPLPESPHYYERLEKQYIEHDPDKANELLDGLGLERGANGMRTMPNGDPLFIDIEVIEAFEPWPEIMEMVKKYWADVGVDSGIRVVDRALLFEHIRAYEIDCTTWTGADAITCLLDPRYYMAYNPNASKHASAWADWRLSNGERGIEPPEIAKKQHELYAQIEAEPDPEKQAVLFRQILDIAAEQFWAIGTTRYYQAYGIVKNNFKNVPAMVWQWHISSSPAQSNPEQYYIEQ